MERKQNSYEQEYAEQRVKWQEEVRETRHEEEQEYFKVEKSLAPFCAAIVLCCFVAYLLMGGWITLGSMAFYTLWGGSLVVLLRYSVKLNQRLDKICIGILICSALAVLFDMLSAAQLLSDTYAQISVVLYQLACIAGVIFSCIALKDFWIRRKEIKEMEITNPWS
ncbi:MAG: hypothetical protein II239_05310 [Peptococcaceae bacterium]|nr:hypothetical protein [Peptococcaceae bacterium]